MTDRTEHEADGLTRRQLLQTGAAGATLLSASGLLAACGGSSATTSTSAKGGTPRKGGTLTVGMISLGSAETIHPLKAINYPDFARVPALFDPLFFLAGNQQTVPWLAEQGTPNSDATLWTLELRKGVTFHNGKPFGADDVVYTVQSWANPASYIYPYVGNLIDFGGVKATGTHTVSIPLKTGMAALPTVLTYPQAVVVPAGGTDFAHPVGTGPFKFESFTPGSQSVFTANPNYWVTGKPYVDKLVINSSFTAESARTNALLSGEVNYLPSMDPTLAKENASGGQIKVAAANGAGFFAFYMRTNGGPTQDPRIRSALKLIPDRPALLTGALNGYGVVQNDVIGYGLPYFDASLVRAHDPEQAKALLKAAGVPGMTITLKTSTTNVGMLQSATLFAEQAKAAGVTVNLQQISPANYLVPTAGYPYDFAQTAWNPVPSVPMFYLLSYNGAHAAYNETRWGYNDPQFAAALKQAMGTVDPTTATDRWMALQRQQFDEGGYISWSTWPYIDGWLPSVNDLKPAPAGSAGNYDWKEAWIS